MIRNFIYVVTDGILDDLARKSIIGCSNIYAAHDPIIYLVTLDAKIDTEDEVWKMINPKAKIINLSLTEDDLRTVLPNLMDKKFETVTKEDGKVELSHWENAKRQNQHLAEFSDLAIFYMMVNQPTMSFLYMDSDVLPILPIQSGNSFIVSYDKGNDGNDYINSSFIYIPEGFQEMKERWAYHLDNELVDSRHFRYGLPGPIAFDKFLGKTAKMTVAEQRAAGKDYTVIALDTSAFNILTYKEVYQAAVTAIENDKPIVMEIEHTGPALNIPRSAITSALTHKRAKELKLLLGLIHDKIGAQVIDFTFYPKEVKGISYYEDLRDNKE